MNFFSNLPFANISLLQGLELLLRVIAACVFGFLIGLERTRRFKDAGVRTYTLVACASALMMIVSKYSALDMFAQYGTIPDSGRIAAQVVSGISFLGAGVIFKHGASIKGLTTAAGIWITSGIGLAVGAGMYILGLFVTFIVIVLQMVMHKVNLGKDALEHTNYTVTVKDADLFLKCFPKIADENPENITYNSVIKNGSNNTTTFDINIVSSKKHSADGLVLQANNDENIISFITNHIN